MTKRFVVVAVDKATGKVLDLDGATGNMPGWFTDKASAEEWVAGLDNGLPAGELWLADMDLPTTTVFYLLDLDQPWQEPMLP